MVTKLVYGNNYIDECDDVVREGTPLVRHLHLKTIIMLPSKTYKNSLWINVYNYNCTKK